MLRASWNSIARSIAVALLALSLVLPLYSFSSLGGGGGKSVRAWEVARQDPVVGVALLLPLVALGLSGRKTRRPWNRIVPACVSVVLAGSAFVVYLVSTLSFSIQPMPFPLYPLPALWTSSDVGIGCWAFAAASALILIVWWRSE